MRDISILINKKKKPRRPNLKNLIRGQNLSRGSNETGFWGICNAAHILEIRTRVYLLFIYYLKKCS